MLYAPFRRLPHQGFRLLSGNASFYSFAGTEDQSPNQFRRVLGFLLSQQELYITGSLVSQTELQEMTFRNGFGERWTTRILS